jgi:peroxiredoxin
VVQLGELQEYYGLFQQAGVQVYAVSVDAPEHNALLKARLGAGYGFLSDAKAELLDALGIRHRHWPGMQSAFPTQYLLDCDGTVRWLYQAETWRVRPHPREALVAVAGLESPKRERDPVEAA